MKSLGVLACLLLVLVSIGSLVSICNAYWTEDDNAWSYNSNNTKIKAVAIADVDGDSYDEVITGGQYFDGTREVAQLNVTDGTSLNEENSCTWYLVGSTTIWSIAVGDIDGDSDQEIVVACDYYNSQIRPLLKVFDGSTLTEEHNKTLSFTYGARITSVTVENVDGDGAIEITAGGYYWDGIRYRSFLYEYNHTTTPTHDLTLERSTDWYGGYNTVVISIAADDVDSDGSKEIVAGGYVYLSNVSKDAGCLFIYGGTLSYENSKAWYDVGNTYVYSVALGNVDGDGTMEIVAGGYYQDGCWKASLKTFHGTNLYWEDVNCWYWTSNTYVVSVAIGDCDSDGSVEVVSGGYFYDSVRYNSHLGIFRGSDLECESCPYWYDGGNTYIYSVAVGCVALDGWEDIATGGSYYTSSHDNSQAKVWTAKSSAALIWGTYQYVTGDQGSWDEWLWSQNVTQYIYNQFDDKARYDRCINSVGNGWTQPNNVYSNVSYCETNYANTAIFYKGHIYPNVSSFGYQCPNYPSCTFNHSSVYDHEGDGEEDDQIIDCLIHENNGVSRLSSKTHDFVFIWSCGWGDPVNKGALSGVHSWGMMTSWMGDNTLQYDGYANPDGKDRCFISFESASIMFKNVTNYQGKKYGNWAKEFYYWALQSGYTIKLALDKASQTACGKDNFIDDPLYTGYNMTIGGQQYLSHMRVYGDVNHVLPR